MHVDRFTIFEAARTPKGKLTEEQIRFLDKYVRGDWEFYPETGLVDVEGDVNMGGRKLNSFQGIRFGKVTGNFICFDNQLTSLKGAPQEVEGSFFCDFNQLTSLEGAPQKVGRGFHCTGNKLTSLVGAPRKVEGFFNCSFNQLTSLEGSPQEVGGGFSCSNNQLTSLAGAPEEVDIFFCYDNLLTSLEGAPRKARGGFFCSNNQLTSWKGFPKISLEMIDFERNPALLYLVGLEDEYKIDSSYYDDPLSAIV